jgi:flagellar biosynthesis protein FlhG
MNSVLSKKKKHPIVVAITSGKGGVGKTLTTVNLAIATQRIGLKTIVLDGDMGLANVDIVLGLQSRYNINDVLEETITLDKIILDGPLGVRIIPSGSGITKLTQLSYIQKLQLMDELELLDTDFDVMFVDTGAGISENVLHFNSMADQIIVVTTPEPHAIADAYAMIKVMSEQYDKNNFSLIVNMVQSVEEGNRVAGRIADVAKNFLGVDIKIAGSVPVDPQMQYGIVQRRAVSDKTVHTISGQAWTRIANDIFGEYKNEQHSRDVTEVWRELFWMNQGSDTFSLR